MHTTAATVSTPVSGARTNGKDLPKYNPNQISNSQRPSRAGKDFMRLEDLGTLIGADEVNAIRTAITAAEPIESAVADRAAEAIRHWAEDRGATHFCHWFHPLTGGTAEKHDSICVVNLDGKTISKFDGGDLVRCEPDASSFPHGGVRQTEQARGYTVWDPGSPMFISDAGGARTLCIPAVFVSWSGESLDYKTPLLRSSDAISTQALRVLEFFGTDHGVQRITPIVGAEQEFFLVDRELYLKRPDLVSCGRTLIGLPAAKNQQLSDCYFGDMPERVRAYLVDVERELKRVGVPVLTRHNEVAPNQFEVAPVFAEVNIACDQQALMMQTLQRIARQHGFECLLHEKPFADINGSGKHNNWSLCTDSGTKIFDSGATDEELLQFMVFVTAVIASADRWQGILRASVASIGNDHRMGGHEAPPAIVSVFLGDELAALVEQLIAGEALLRRQSSGIAVARGIPVAERQPCDRNRTSPFAFTGNKFEFRAVGSTAAIAWPNTVINTIVADGLQRIMDELEQRIVRAPQVDRFDTLRQLLGETLKHHKRILFEGNNYSDEWTQEAVSRGLDNLVDTASALGQWNLKSARDLFAGQNVMSRSELRSRANVLEEQYQSWLEIEAESLLNLLRRYILPAALRYHRQIAQQSIRLGSFAESRLASRLEAGLNSLVESIDTLERASAPDIDGSCLDAESIAKRIKSAMAAARDAADRLEAILPADTWPFPDYEELLRPLG